MRIVAVIDDQGHALKQLIYAFPDINKDDIAFIHFSSMKAFLESEIKKPFMILLDFFLSIDKQYGADFINEIECDYLICFSSKKEMSDYMARKTEESMTNKIKHVASIQKIKEDLENIELRDYLRTVFR